MSTTEMKQQDFYRTEGNSVYGPYDGFYYEPEDTWVVPELGMVFLPGGELWTSITDAQCAVLERRRPGPSRGGPQGDRFFFGKPVCSPELDVLLVLRDIARRQTITRRDLRSATNRILPQLIDPSATSADVRFWIARALGYRSWAHLLTDHDLTMSTYTGCLDDDESEAITIRELLGMLACS